MITHLHTSLQCSIVNYSHHTIHYVPRTYLSYTWKFVHFDHLHAFHLLPIPHFWQPPLWEHTTFVHTSHYGNILRFLYSPVDAHLGCFPGYGLLWIKLLWTFLCKTFCGFMFFYLLDKYLGIEFLDLRVDVYLTFKESASFLTLYYFTLLPSNVWEFQLLHIFTNIWCCQSYFSYSSGWILASQ